MHSVTNLGGALVRRSGGRWHWRDGSLEPLVFDLPLVALLPHFERVSTRGGICRFVPDGWRALHPYDKAAADLVAELVGGGRATPWASVSLNGRVVLQRGTLVAETVWHTATSRPIAGWRNEDAPALLEKARAMQDFVQTGDVDLDVLLARVRKRFLGPCTEYGRRPDRALAAWLHVADELAWLCRGADWWLDLELIAWEQRPADLSNLDEVHARLFAHCFRPH